MPNRRDLHPRDPDGQGRGSEPKPLHERSHQWTGGREQERSLPHDVQGKEERWHPQGDAPFSANPGHRLTDVPEPRTVRTDDHVRRGKPGVRASLAKVAMRSSADDDEVDPAEGAGFQPHLGRRSRKQGQVDFGGSEASGIGPYVAANAQRSTRRLAPEQRDQRRGDRSEQIRSGDRELPLRLIRRKRRLVAIQELRLVQDVNEPRAKSERSWGGNHPVPFPYQQRVPEGVSKPGEGMARGRGRQMQATARRRNRLLIEKNPQHPKQIQVSIHAFDLVHDLLQLYHSAQELSRARKLP